MKRALILALTLTLLLACTLSSCGKDKSDKGGIKRVYVSEVRITSSHTVDDNGEKYVIIRPDETGELRYKIECTVLPNNATNKEIDFQFDAEIDYASVAEDGTVVFDKAKVGERGLAVTVTVTPKDGTDKRDSITVFALNR